MSTGLPQPGDRLGDWIVDGGIGQGGLASIFRVKHQVTGRWAAVKVLLPSKLSDEESERMRREYVTLSRLNHPHIVGALDSGQTRGLPWFAMELIDGADLSVVVESWEAQPPPDRIERAVQIFRELGAALGCVHAAGIVHRDIKPQNVLLDRDGHVHLGDFGGVKDNDNFRSNLTMTGRLVGTVAFMAPEQITGDAVTPRTDLYGLGAVFYLMLSGRKPIGSDTLAGFLARHLSETPRPLSDLNPNIPRSIERVCMRLLEKEPGRRFGSAEEAVAALALVPAPAHVGREAVIAAVRARLRELGPAGGTVRVYAASGSGRQRFAAAVADLGPGLGLRVRVELEDEGVGVGPRDAPVHVVLVDEPPPPGQLTLAPLNREQLRELLRDRGLHGAVAAHLARRFLAELDGFPGTTVHTLRAMVRQGWLERLPDGGLRALVPVETFQVDPLPLPDEEVDGARVWLRGLPHDAAEVAVTMAVLGTSAPAGLLAQLLGWDEAAIEEAVGRIQADGLLTRETEGSTAVTLFALTPARRQQAVYEAMPAADRARAHRRVAEGLQAWYRRRPGTVSETVASHLLRAGDAVGAYPLLVSAAARARSRSGEMAARGLCERALAVAPVAEAHLTLIEAARLRRTLHLVYGDALRALGQPLRAEDAYARALLAARGEGNPEEAARAMASRGLARAMLGFREEARMLLGEGMAGLAQGHAIWAEVAAMRLRLLLDAGETEPAKVLAERLLERSIEAREPVGEVDALCALSCLARVHRKPARALDLLDRAQTRSEDCSERRPALQVLCQRAELALEEGNFSLVERLADEIDSVGELSGVPFAAELALGFRVGLGRLRGADVGSQARDALLGLIALETRDLVVFAPFVRALPGEIPATLLTRLSSSDWFPAPGVGADILRLALLARAHRDPGARSRAAHELLPLVGPGTQWMPVPAARAVADAASALHEVGEKALARSLIERALGFLDPRAQRAVFDEVRLSLS